jgi:hypothetical protein
MTKLEFEVKLAREFGFNNFYRSIIREEDNILNLYYRSSDSKHIATWMSGEGWIFESAYD